MKQFLLAITFIAAASVTLGQATDKEALRQTLDLFLSAIKNNNATAADKLLAESYRIYGGFVCIKNKKQRLDAVKSGQIKYTPQKSEALAGFSIYGTNASIQFTATAYYTACTEDGKEVTNKDCPVILVFIKQDGHWLIESECLGGGCLH